MLLCVCMLSLGIAQEELKFHIVTWRQWNCYCWNSHAVCHICTPGDEIKLLGRINFVISLGGISLKGLGYENHTFMFMHLYAQVTNGWWSSTWNRRRRAKSLPASTLSSTTAASTSRKLWWFITSRCMTVISSFLVLRCTHWQPLYMSEKYMQTHTHTLPPGLHMTLVLQVGGKINHAFYKKQMWYEVYASLSLDKTCSCSSFCSTQIIIVV